MLQGSCLETGIRYLKGFNANSTLMTVLSTLLEGIEFTSVMKKKKIRLAVYFILFFYEQRIFSTLSWEERAKLHSELAIM